MKRLRAECALSYGRGLYEARWDFPTALKELRGGLKDAAAAEVAAKKGTLLSPETERGAESVRESVRRALVMWSSLNMLGRYGEK